MNRIYIIYNIHRGTYIIYDESAVFYQPNNVTYYEYRNVHYHKEGIRIRDLINVLLWVKLRR